MEEKKTPRVTDEVENKLPVHPQSPAVSHDYAEIVKQVAEIRAHVASVDKKVDSIAAAVNDNTKVLHGAVFSNGSGTAGGRARTIKKYWSLSMACWKTCHDIISAIMFFVR